MNKIIFLSLALLLGACKHTPDTGLGYTAKMPDLPPHLAVKAESLPQMTDPSMGGQQIQGSSDDMQYNNVSHQVNNLIDLYNCVKESINQKKEVKTCLQ